jgi:hypothetical protein
MTGRSAQNQEMFVYGFLSPLFFHYHPSHGQFGAKNPRRRENFFGLVWADHFFGSRRKLFLTQIFLQ